MILARVSAPIILPHWGRWRAAPEGAPLAAFGGTPPNGGDKVGSTRNNGGRKLRCRHFSGVRYIRFTSPRPPFETIPACVMSGARIPARFRAQH